MIAETFDPVLLADRAAEVAAVLKALGNPRRLLILCDLAQRGSATPGELAARAGLSQSALSQHLALMRDEGLVTYRREAQTLWYRIADPRVQDLLETLYALWCATDNTPSPERLPT
jgi:DNA-binding transcriptional ArsR family regulator